MLLSRKNLKNRFGAGQMPCEEDFCDMIDSMVNVEDDGFNKTAHDGLKLSQLTESGKLMSFYVNATEGTPLWQMELRKNSDGEENSSNLHVTTPAFEESSSVLTLTSAGAVGIGTRHPECEMDVNGVVACSGRIGKENEKLKVPADGEWHDITEQLTGCEAFEVIAGVGGQDGEGRFALTHAVALNVFHGKHTLKKMYSYCGGRRSRIDIRWTKGSEKYTYKLQLRTHCAYADGIFVRYKMTKLWFDNMMVGSLG